MTNRIKIIDGIRGIAILLVIAYHYVFGNAVLDSPLANKLIKFLNLGWSGVDLFFVLSGFLIVGILLDSKGSNTYFSTFYIRRGLRILPLYYILLLLYLILPEFILNDDLFKDSVPFWSYLSFTQNFFMIRHNFGLGWIAITWSLAVEEQFYLLLPALIWKLDKKNLVYTFLVLITLAPIICLYFSGLGGYIFPLARSNSILMGGLLSIAYREKHIKSLLIEHQKIIITLLFMFLVGAGVIILKEIGAPGSTFTQLWLGILYTLFLATCTLFPNKILSSLIENPILIWFGTRSYSIYLFHLFFLKFSHYFILGKYSTEFTNWNELYVTLIAFALTLIAAEVSFRYFESIFLTFGKRFQYKTEKIS